MKFTSLALGFASASLAHSSLALALTQPNGTIIPVGAGLQTMFNTRTETINALADAAILPETFVPSCALTFQVIQRNAGYRNSFGWYNVTGSRPAASDHHEFLSCTDGVGTVRVLDIRSNPAYLGGEIGFYQATGNGCPTPTNREALFYSQRVYNSDGNGASAFIHLLIYNSTTTPRAFYFAWEDLLSGGDNDFDDLTTFVTGITCSGGGGACQTGNQGICADGTLQCQSGQLSCVQSNTATNEVCDGLDNDCDGLLDEGDLLCSAGDICDKGTCVPECRSGEFTCPPGKVCDNAGVCVDPACADVICPEGQRCIDGTCKGPCDGVVCPHDQVCRVGACVDPCSAITCDDEQVCVAGACIDRCECSGCAADQTCQSDGICLPTACVPVTCPLGQYCSTDGTCIDACMGAVCPTGERCVDGQCVESPDGSGGGESAGSGMLAGSGGSSGTLASGTGGEGGSTLAGGGSNGDSNGSTGTTGSCGCRLPGDEDGGAPGWAIPLLGLVGVAARMRRRRETAAS
jgi:MYXO-CTERM domain-containing protein